MDDALTITTFGRLSIRRGDVPVTDLASRKVEALLVYVACGDRPQSREVLAEMLWEERSQRRSLGNLPLLYHATNDACNVCAPKVVGERCVSTAEVDV